MTKHLCSRRKAREGTARRLGDILVGGVLLTFATPLLAACAALIRFTMGSPVLFRQARLGLDGQPFTLVKFRTMQDANDPAGNLQPDTERITRLGAFLRSTSLDELPELWNVLKGDMSLVGPRPLLVEYLSRYTPEQARRHEVKPGITGLAQIAGRNTLSWEEKFALDVWYVDHQSNWLDLKIVVKTMWQVLAQRGITAPSHATMPEFRPGHTKGTDIGTKNSHEPPQ